MRFKSIEEKSKQFVMLLPLVQELILKPIRGITLKDLEKEEPDYERCKRQALLGMFHGIILKDYEGNSFEQKFKNYLYYSGIAQYKWIKTTDYDSYYQSLVSIVSKIYLECKSNNIHR